MYPIEKYRYYTTKTADGSQKVIAVSTYAGKTVRGVAICHPSDTFDPQKGKEIAAARCAAKIAAKRFARAQQKEIEAYKAWKVAEKRLDNMDDYVNDARDAFYDAEGRVVELLAEL